MEPLLWQGAAGPIPSALPDMPGYDIAPALEAAPSVSVHAASPGFSQTLAAPNQPRLCPGNTQWQTAVVQTDALNELPRREDRLSNLVISEEAGTNIGAAASTTISSHSPPPLHLGPTSAEQGQMSPLRCQPQNTPDVRDSSQHPHAWTAQDPAAHVACKETQSTSLLSSSAHQSQLLEAPKTPKARSRALSSVIAERPQSIGPLAVAGPPTPQHQVTTVPPTQDGRSIQTHRGILGPAHSTVESRKPQLLSSSPLSSIITELDDDEFADTPLLWHGSSPTSQEGATTAPPDRGKSILPYIDFDYDGPEERQYLRLKPTSAQWADFPSILDYARRMGAEDDGCFKVIIPGNSHESLPEKSTEKVFANAYKIRQIKRNGFWQVTTVPSEGTFSSSDPGPECLDSVEEALQKLKKMFNKSKDRQLRNVRYRVDVPAWTTKQRREAGVPDQSPLHPLKGDKLDQTKAIIPGIHTPYVYESGPHFGATFQIHAEDFRLCSLNHLYKGRKIWIVVPSTAVDFAEEAFGRKQKCSQFMRHRAEFFFPEKLEKMGIPYRIVDQRPGETIVILPDAYHEGFSTGYTIAEAKNYAETNWTIDTYQPCELSCELLTAIPAAFMAPVEEDQPRLDLCAPYDDKTLHPTKRNHEEHGVGEEPDLKRIKT